MIFEIRWGICKCLSPIPTLVETAEHRRDFANDGAQAFALRPKTEVERCIVFWGGFKERDDVIAVLFGKALPIRMARVCPVAQKALPHTL